MISLLLLGTENPAKGRARVEALAPGVVAAVTAGDGESVNPKRSPNEDSLAVVRMGEQAWAALVADAHFGADAGEIVARAFVEAAARLDPVAANETTLAELLYGLDDRLFRERQTGSRSETTALAALVRPGEVAYANVGDSRLFVLGEARGAKLLTGSRPVFLGQAKPLREREGKLLEAGRLALAQGTVVLLASDGIDREMSGMTPDEVAALYATTEPLEQRTARLLARGGLARNGGGRDNLSVVVLQAPAASHPAPGA